ncbi:unnamed protein product [Cladocopium goreaui]|uniref:Chaperone protein DnaJ n=1 Tax=Cladocopium goreaui TaxID=2562237 RepID=A0A9P1DQI5_9DINO|nr:unnamed protein product [Cladocopium goreaui]
MASWRLLRRQFLACLLARFVGQSFVNGAHRQVAPRSVLLAARDPWAVLELTPGASRDDVKKAFREKIRKAHPDAGGTAKEFKEVREAYQAALNEAGTGTTSGPGSTGPKGSTRGWSISDFYRWRREQVNKQKVEWDKDAAGSGHHWWSSAEQRAEQKEQARAMDEEPQPRGRPRDGAGARSERRTEKRAKEKRTRSSRERFEDDSVREWNDFLSKRGRPVKEKTSVATRATRRSEKIKDPVVTHRSIATMEGDVRVPVFRSRSGRCYYVSPLTNREVTVPS